MQQKVTKYSLVMTPTPCTVAGYIGVRIHALVHLLVYLLTYLHSWLWAYKAGNISETVEDKAKVTIYDLPGGPIKTGPLYIFPNI